MTVRMDQLSWVEYARRVREQSPVVFLPCGATEQHGPHLPLGTDALLASALCEDVARQVDGLVAPALSYGYKSQPKCGGGQHFCGTTSLDGQTLIALVRDAVREFARHGVTRLVLVDGHYENQWVRHRRHPARPARTGHQQPAGSDAPGALGFLQRDHSE